MTAKKTTAPTDTVDAEVPAGLGARIAAVRKVIKRIGHDKMIGDADKASSYSITSHEAIKKELRPLMAQYGLIDYLNLESMEIVETGVEYGKFTKRKLLQHRGQFLYTLLNADNMEESISFRVIGYGDDAGDKGPGKASTYALKTAQKIIFQIEAGDEGEEGRVSEDMISPPALKSLSPENLDAILSAADEYFGDDAEDYLKRMCENIFNVTAVKEIPDDHIQQALKLLHNQAIRDNRIAVEAAPADDDV